MPSSTLIPRAMTVADIAGGLRLSHASGWNQLAEDWRVFIETPASGAFLVERDGEVLGTSAYIRYDSLAWVAMMLVDPGERRSGLGSRLLEAALKALRDSPCVGLDATPLGAPLYRKHGFVEHSELVRMKGVAPLATAGRGAAMQDSDLAEVCGRDREVFGADRSRLLAELLRRAPECARVVREGSDLLGYCFGRPGRLYTQMGPVVASDAAVAQDLARACFARLPEACAIAVDVNRYDSDWLAYLRSAGFVEERPFTRMFLRGHAHPGIPERQYAICGPEFA
ncbi:MAG: GNAT family N-acetyltransferase [Candidatus Solibacter sp.]